MLSILNSIKKLLGISEDYTHFDHDIMTHINSAFFVLNQLGVGPEEPFSIEDGDSEWTDFIEDNQIEMVKTYVYEYVKRIFDPPSNSSHLNALKDDMKEMEWRMNVQVDSGNEETTYD